MQIPFYLALTGRIKTWLENNDKGINDVLPVSCTTFSVEDSMEGKNGIEDSWVFTSHGLRKAAGVALDLSKLRPRGTDNGRGLISSGVLSFAKFYSLLNQELRRGGVYKNGAVTLFLDVDHPDLIDFLNSGSEIPWAKRALYIDTTSWNSLSVKDREYVAKKVNNGEVWLAKKQYDSYGERLYSNVCLEVVLPHRGTCLLSSVNLGALDYQDIKAAFKKSMAILCRIHGYTGVANSGHYLSSVVDRQVGLGVIGLSNMLAGYRITYLEFVEALEDALDDVPNTTVAGQIARTLRDAYMEAAEVARQHGMVRAFAIAPTASLSYNHKDKDGFTTSPEISPPLDWSVDRDSDTFGVETFNYHPDCEIASQVGWDVQFRLLTAWQAMMDRTGMAHAISANLWTSFTVTEDWITNKFLPSSLKTTYYRLPVDQLALDKSEIVTPESEDKLVSIYTEETEDDVACGVDEMLTAQNDPNYCIPCGG